MPALTKRYSLVVSIILIFIIWGAWHFPILFKGADVVVPWLLTLFGATSILTWIWLKTDGNIFVLAIAHASINSSQFFLENKIGQQLVLESWKVSGYLYLVAGIFFLLLMRKELAHKVIQEPKS